MFEAAVGLLRTSDVVVGPADDGGYYRVGASAARPRLFESTPLGTHNAREALIANARALGLLVALTAPWYDIDVPADLRRLDAELRIDPSRAPRTAALLASWRDVRRERAG